MLAVAKNRIAYRMRFGTSILGRCLVNDMLQPMPSGPFRSDGAQPTDSQDSGGYRLLVGKQAIAIEPGETIVGREEDCGIVVPHSTVSRRHARLVLEDGELCIEDLDSANGTYVNRARAFGRVPLERGDWIALGSCEMEVLPVLPETDYADLDRPTPASGVGILGQVALSRQTPESSAAETDRQRRTPCSEVDFELAGRLADRMLAVGRMQAAEQILGEPIVRILDAARAGDPPTIAMVDALGHYALRLANATDDGRWVDAAIEVHMLVGRPLRVETLRRLKSLQARASVGDRALIARYYETVRSGLGPMTPDDRILVSLLSELVFELEQDG
jgi:hypothetical protein